MADPETSISGTSLIFPMTAIEAKDVPVNIPTEA